MRNILPHIAPLRIGNSLHTGIVYHLGNLKLTAIVGVVHSLRSLGCIQILHGLFSNCLHEAHPLFRTQMRFELLRGQQLVGVDRYLVLVRIMLARRYESAFGTSLIEDEVTLQIDCRTLELVKPLIFQQLPHVLLGHVVSLFYQRSFFLVEENGRPIILLLVNNIVQMHDLSRRICHVFEQCRI